MNAPADVRARPAQEAVATLVAQLVADYGERAVTNAVVRDHHGHGEGLADPAPPDVVVYPKSTAEVASIVSLCHAARVPVIAFGVGTSLEGHVAALYGGVCLDFSTMNRVVEVNADDLDCRVEAGVTREQLNAELKGTGLFFPIDPGANATIGGMAATRASGTNAVRWGWRSSRAPARSSSRTSSSASTTSRPRSTSTACSTRARRCRRSRVARSSARCTCTAVRSRIRTSRGSSRCRQQTP